MSGSEIYPNPTVKMVIFEIRFPNLFFIENRIGDYQTEIMTQFPNSSLLFRRHVVFADTGPGASLEDIRDQAGDDSARKIWHFKSELGHELNVTGNSLDIKSTHHKTYDHGHEDKFRDVISFTVEKFLEVTRIPLINRIGLRYIDECPIPEKSTERFLEYYNSAFPLSKFTLEDAMEMDVKTVVRRGEYFLRYIESLQTIDEKPVLVLDSDGFAKKIESNRFLEVTDDLHDLIIAEYENTIKEPVKEIMRGRGEV